MLFHAKVLQGQGTGEEDSSSERVGVAQSNSNQSGPGTWLLFKKFALLMYRAGPNGPRATCVELVPDEDDPDGPLRLCGGFGTVNRIMSDIKSYRDKDQHGA
ncbi:hypothetical protein V8C86DRAFT_3033800 [Haematococcus lacustris]